jgi:hypothetical protein
LTQLRTNPTGVHPQTLKRLFQHAARGFENVGEQIKCCHLRTHREGTCLGATEDFACGLASVHQRAARRWRSPNKPRPHCSTQHFGIGPAGLEHPADRALLSLQRHAR